MKLTQSVSFWIIVVSAILGCLLGSITHWVIGLIFFLLLAGKAAIIGLVLDTVSGTMKYHHDREDLRVKKILASELYLKSLNNGVRPKI